MSNHIAGSDDIPRPFATYRLGETVKLASISGQLLLDDGCVYIQPAGRRRTPVMFPEDVGWEPSTMEIRLHNGTVRIGEHVSFVGGGEPASTATYIPPSCVYDDSEELPFFSTY